MREPENIRAVEQLDIDWMGFIFWPQSPRYVSQISSRAGIIPDYPSLGDGRQETGDSRRETVDGRRETVDGRRETEDGRRETGDGSQPLPIRGEAGRGPVKRVGVFVDDMPQNIVTRVYNYDLSLVQLHGSESAVMIDNLRRTLDPDIKPGVQIIKALSISTAADLERTKEYEGHVDYFLFDTKTPLMGGSGKQFDWSVLEAYDGSVPFLLSGGIGPDDAERIRHFRHPQCVGIDLNSRFETAPAVKDVELLREFVHSIRS